MKHEIYVGSDKPYIFLDETILNRSLETLCTFVRFTVDKKIDDKAKDHTIISIFDENCIIRWVEAL